MRIARILVLSFVMALAAAGPGRAGLSDDARNLCDEWVAKVNAGDVDGAAARFDGESEFLARHDRAMGQAAAKSYFKTLFASYRVHINLIRRSSEVLPVLIGQSGTYEEDLTPLAGGATVHREGRFLMHFLRKSDPRVWVVQKIWM